MQKDTQPSHQDWGRARTAGNRFARDDTESGLSWGKQLPGERPRETAALVAPLMAHPILGEEDSTSPPRWL